MNPDRLRIRLLKTHYPHWGAHTAFNALPRVFRKDRFRIAMNEVSLADDSWFLRFFPRRLLQRLKGNRLQEYKMFDFLAELGMFARALWQTIDLVHFIDAEHSFLFLPALFRRVSRLKAMPKIIAMYHQPPSVLERIMDPAVAARADHVLTVAPEQADFFKRFLPAERVSTILLGVDTGHFQPPAAKKEDGRFRCLAGGVWLRDYPALLETARLLAGISGLEFHLVAPEFPVQASVGNVFFHVGIGDSELLELYRSCQVLFLPLQDATANTFLMEGAACGLPIVSSDLPSLRAYFPGEEALLVKDNDPRAFAAALIRLWDDVDLRRRMSACARERALQLSWERIAPEYERLYDRVMAGPGGGEPC